MTKGLDGFLSEKIPEPEVLPVQEGASVIFKAAKAERVELMEMTSEFNSLLTDELSPP